MKKVIKIGEISNLYAIINNSKYLELDKSDMIKIWKISRLIKPIAILFQEDCKDAWQKMLPYDNFEEQLLKARDYETNKTSMTKEEYYEFLKDYLKYKNIVELAILEFANKEVELEFDTISEETFGKYMSINDWTLDQATSIGDFICD